MSHRPMPAAATSGKLAPSRPGIWARRKPLLDTGRLFLLLLFATIPLIPTPPMAFEWFGVSTLRLQNFLPVFAFVAFFVRGGLFRNEAELDRKAMLVFWVYIGFFCLGFLRSIPNLEEFALSDRRYMDVNLRSYINTGLILKVLWALSFVYVLKEFRTVRDLRLLFAIISIGLFAVSCTVIISVARDPSILFSFNRQGIAEMTSLMLGMHYNNVASLYITTGPLLTYLAIAQRNVLWKVSYALAFVTILLLESRTGILLFVAASAATLVMLRQAKILLMAAPVAIGVAIVAFGSFLTGLMTMGFQEEGSFSLYYFLSGREGRIWAPLLAEWLDDPSRFWLGGGQQSILASQSRMTRVIYTVAEAHNAYIELFLDNGFILFLLFVGALLVLCRRGWRLGRQLNSGLYWALLLCCFSFLVAGFTGRRFYPDPETMLIFPILGALICVARIRLAQGTPVAGRIRKLSMRSARAEGAAISGRKP